MDGGVEPHSSSTTTWLTISLPPTKAAYLEARSPLTHFLSLPFKRHIFTFRGEIVGLCGCPARIPYRFMSLQFMDAQVSLGVPLLIFGSGIFI